MTRPDQLELLIVDVHAQLALAERLAEACRRAGDERGWHRVADELDQIFGRIGHPVSYSVLRNAFGDRERNYVRAEWVTYFAAISEEVAAVVAEAAGRALAAARSLSTAEELELYRELVPNEFGAAGQRLVNRLSSKGGRRSR